MKRTISVIRLLMFATIQELQKLNNKMVIIDLNSYEAIKHYAAIKCQSSAMAVCIAILYIQISLNVKHNSTNSEISTPKSQPSNDCSGISL